MFASILIKIAQWKHSRSVDFIFFFFLIMEQIYIKKNIYIFNFNSNKDGLIDTYLSTKCEAVKQVLVYVFTGINFRIL